MSKLATIGYDVQVIQELAKTIHAVIRKEHDYTELSQTRRGFDFEVKLANSRIARVTVELDRVEPSEYPTRWTRPGARSQE